ncbi:unnamed protein product [Linum trigynum]|uniref:Uncharacterized protein n=1 Tax=Linum trigynum TaxID=586398 RepID=A0AAV2D9P8_9ROSI
MPRGSLPRVANTSRVHVPVAHHVMLSRYDAAATFALTVESGIDVLLASKDLLGMARNGCQLLSNVRWRGSSRRAGSRSGRASSRRCGPTGAPTGSTSSGIIARGSSPSSARGTGRGVSVAV